ncbi:hypothetical protein [Gudongella sp. DL1XJH-153]|uniref:hypothetical protein n=1 Tax=Gudongella sp. DL1XJH-153 TaxID=3409804 RepID=UPI003BB72F4C
MDSPIIILVFWVLINILLKSSRDKKKAEQARRRTGQGSSQNRQKPQEGRSRMNTGMKDFKKALDDYKEQIERELNPEKKVPVKPIANDAKRTVEKPENRQQKRELRTFREGRFWEDIVVEEDTPDDEEIEVVVTGASKRKGSKSGSGGLFDIRNDIIKGVVYSEILDKPKSLNKRRSPR